MRNFLRRSLCLFVMLCAVLLLPVTEAFAAPKAAEPEGYGKEETENWQLNSGEDYLSIYDKISNYMSTAGAFQNGDIRIAIDTSLNDESVITRIVSAYIADYPEHFWVRGYSGCVWSEDVITKVKISVTSATEEEKAAFTSAADALMEEIALSDGMSEYEKAKAIYDKLIEKVSYDGEAENAENAYGALVNGKAGSAGYAKAYQLLLQKAGMQSGTVSGKVKATGEQRTWNFVRIDGEYYYTDAAADDMGAAPAYSHFNVTSEKIEEEAEINPLSYGDLPECTSADAAYKGEPAVHKHEYNMAVQGEKYIRTSNCGENVTYYKSCACGEASAEEYFTSDIFTEHSFGEYKYNADATCRSDGTETAACSKCGVNDTKAAAGTKLEHNYSPAGTKDPTCTVGGYTLYRCEGCSAEYTDDETAPTGHSGGSAACEKRAVCEKCGNEYGELAEHDYDMEHWHDGGSEGHCRICKNCSAHSETEEHVPGPDATEQSPQVCSECGYIIMPSLEHVHRLALVPAKPSTCTEHGNNEYYVCPCGKWFMDALGNEEIIIKENVVLPLKNHSFINYASNGNATCTADGTETALCENCGTADTRTAEGSMLPHSYKAEVFSPTCTDGGFTRYTCTGCLDTYEADIVKELGHSWLNATCDKAKTCERCKIEDGMAEGHSYSEWCMDSKAHWKECTKEGCGKEIEKTRGTHSDDEYNGYCSVCGYALPEIYSVISASDAVTVSTVGKPIVIKIDAEKEKLTNVIIDGETVMRECYSVSSGSTVVSFTGEYMKTLSVGKHTAKFVFVDGTATTEFEIKNVVVPPVIGTEVRPPKLASITIEINSPREETNPNTGAAFIVKAVKFGVSSAAKNL